MIDLSARTLNGHAKLGCLLCVIFLLTGAGMALYRWSFLREAVPVEAVITAYEARKEKGGTDDGDTRYAAVYVFRDAKGHPVEGVSSRATSQPTGNVGDRIRVLYLPGDRRKSIEDRFSSKWGAALVFGVLGAAFGFPFGLTVYLTGKRMRQERFPQ